jgi:hypothetical protein
MKLKRFFRTHLVIVLLCAMVISFGLPNDSEAGNCFIEGYVVQMVHVGGSVAGFFFREKPIDAGMWTVLIGSGPPNMPEEVAMYNTVRSAYQNNTKMGIITTIAGTCPTPNLSMPGETYAGYLTVFVPPL